ncbi:hypothetical protein JMUB7547_28350 [Staphylococcus aureus]
MSASLVGSEMCIRDRFNDFYGGNLKRSDGEIFAGSVSYTHLTLPTKLEV